MSNPQPYCMYMKPENIPGLFHRISEESGYSFIFTRKSLCWLCLNGCSFTSVDFLRNKNLYLACANHVSGQLASLTSHITSHRNWNWAQFFEPLWSSRLQISILHSNFLKRNQVTHNFNKLHCNNNSSNKNRVGLSYYFMVLSD